MYEWRPGVQSSVLLMRAQSPSQDVPPHWLRPGSLDKHGIRSGNEPGQFWRTGEITAHHSYASACLGRTRTRRELFRGGNCLCALKPGQRYCKLAGTNGSRYNNRPAAEFWCAGLLPPAGRRHAVMAKQSNSSNQRSVNTGGSWTAGFIRPIAPRRSRERWEVRERESGWLVVRVKPRRSLAEAIWQRHSTSDRFAAVLEELSSASICQAVATTARVPWPGFIPGGESGVDSGMKPFTAIDRQWVAALAGA